MLSIVVLIVIVFIIISLLLKPTSENFESLNDEYKRYIFKNKYKDIPYYNFLIDLNNNVEKELGVQSEVVIDKPLKQNVLCNNESKSQVQNKILNNSFNKIPSNFPKLVVFEGSDPLKRNKHDQKAYISPESFKKSISEENKFSDNWYTANIDPGLVIQNNTIINQDIKFQDDSDFNIDIDTGIDDYSNAEKCVYKANFLSEFTNPQLYLTSNNIYFPPRWLEKSPYKNVPLPKTTNLKLWNDMYNCCRNN